MHAPDTALGGLLQVLHALELGGHEHPAALVRSLVERLQAPKTRAAAGSEAVDLLGPRALGDLFLPFLTQQEWWGMLGHACARLQAELPGALAAAEVPEPPAGAAEELARAHGLTRDQARHALVVAGGSPWEAGRLLALLAESSRRRPRADLVLPCLALRVARGRSPQKPTDRTFQGGVPTLAPDEALPACGRCGAAQTFFFQLELPPDSPWKGDLFSVFACASCAPADDLVPCREVPLDGLPRGGRFRLLRTPGGAAVPRPDYVPRVAFARFKAEPAAPDWPHAKIGGVPRWVGEREYSPVEGEFFLCQIEAGHAFPAVPGAQGPRAYDLFVGNAIYVFAHADLPLAKVVVQKP